QFYLSLEDDLLRIFGGERISKLMDKLKIEEDEPIEHVFVTKAISNAQKKVEGFHFDIRKHVLEYDDVMEKQRSIIYTRRRDILGDGVQHLMLELCEDVIEQLFGQHCQEKYADQWDVQGFNRAFEQVFGELPVENWSEHSEKPEELLEGLAKQVRKLYEQKVAYFRKMVTLNFLPDGGTPEEREQYFISTLLDLERQVLLRVNDGLWKDHLLSMDHLREGIGLVGYAQKKPLDEYKRQAFVIFSDLMARISNEAVTTFYHLSMAHPMTEPMQPLQQEQEMEFHHGEGALAEPDRKKKSKKAAPVRKAVVVGRNEPCPCGSGKKYKRCCGSKVQQYA
ncbi:MAG TPA: preprotein translocase subunit SecA, partial [Deltaproteobacteria bacterium]|nr:preprotein translocase subunit SecA [Deltaproteobacteria bacterium]